MSTNPRQLDQDEQHLKLLSVFHYVVSGILALFACLPIFHLGFGIMMLVAPEEFFGAEGDQRQPGPPPEIFGWMVTLMASFFILIGWCIAGLVYYAGRCLARRTKYLYCLVLGGVECTFMPFGTVLGVFTLIVLMRPSVKELFETTAEAEDPFS